MPTTRPDELTAPRGVVRRTVLTPFRRSPRHLLLGATYGVALLAVVLLPIGPSLNEMTIRLSDLTGGALRPTTVGSLLNVVMFVPLGFLAVVLTRRSWWQVTLAAVALSTCFELYQAASVVSRMPSVGDVVTNGVGALLGALAATGLARRGRRAVRIPAQRSA